MVEAGNLIVLDGNPPWVCSLFAAAAGNPAISPPVAVHAIRSMNLAFYRQSPGKVLPALSGRWVQRFPSYWERYAIAPGWQRYFHLSSRWLLRAVRTRVKRLRNVEGIVYTLPHYAQIAEVLGAQGIRGFYYAHDPFQFYDWPVDWTLALQRRMLNACEVSFAISQTLREELQAQTDRPVRYSPNAVDVSFLRELETPVAVPEDLQGMRRPIVGCVGQINSSFDWNLIQRVTTLLADITFVFIGPVIEEDLQRRNQIESFFKTQPNVRWLGRKPHETIPAFLNAFDVLLNPLAVNEHNNRRSPLRFYDYLATSKPIVSTAIDEAFVHEGLIDICTDAGQCAEQISSAIESNHRVDLEKRKSYIQRQTWEVRARSVMETIRGTSA